MAKIPRVQQILDLSIETVNKMSAAELKKNVQILASAANKRLARLGATEIGKVSPAYLSAAKRSYTGAAGGKFGTAGKSRNQLLNEFVAIKSFMGLKTSSVKGWTKTLEKSFERANLEFDKFAVDPEKEKLLYSSLRKILELHPEYVDKKQGYGSDSVKSDLRRVIYNNDYAAELMSQVNEYRLQQVAKSDAENETANADKLKKMLKRSKNKFVVDENGTLIPVDTGEPEDVLRIISMKAEIEYEREEYSAKDDEFFEL